MTQLMPSAVNVSATSRAAHARVFGVRVAQLSMAPTIFSAARRGGIVYTASASTSAARVVCVRSRSACARKGTPGKTASDGVVGVSRETAPAAKAKA